MVACVWCFKYGCFPAWRPKKSKTLILHNSVQPLKQDIHGINGVAGKCSYNIWTQEQSPFISFDQHVQYITRKAFFHPKNIARLCLSFPTTASETLIQTFITSLLDHSNDSPSKIFNELQHIKNSACLSSPRAILALFYLFIYSLCPM